MIKYEIKIHARLNTLNEYIAAINLSRYAGNEMKRKNTMWVRNAALTLKFKLPPIKFNVRFNWLVKNNMGDHDNIAFGKKFIFDGLQDSKSLKDDSPRYINNFSDIFTLDRTLKHTKCIVTFTEV